VILFYLTGKKMNSTLTKLLLTLFLFTLTVFSQEETTVYFETGGIGFKLDKYGAIKVTSSSLSLNHIERASILVSKDSAHVFDYLEDAGSVILPEVVSTPSYGDHELSATINNSYSSIQPDVDVKINVYGWNGSAFGLLRYEITNRESDTLNSLAGIEVLPSVNNSFGFEKVYVDPVKSVIRISKNKFVGFRYLSHRIYSGKVFTWRAGYAADTSYFKWMNSGEIDTNFSAGNDGSVIVSGNYYRKIPPGSIDTFWIAVAVGDSLEAFESNIDTASLKIPGILNSIKNDNVIVDRFNLYQNYPNPFNPVTTIKYSIPVNVNSQIFNVKLNVFDILGNEVAVLVNEQKSPGEYEVRFDAGSLSSGVYFYRLKAGDFIESRKMLLLK